MSGGADDAPVTAAEFERAMAPFGPFEPAPRLAAAVSGGPDSLALCLLLGGWVRARGGHLLALTVDHGLRPDSAQEAVAVGRLLAARGIPHETLAWTGDKPATGLQEAARDARHALLAARCRRGGILHLCLGHQAEDQAETLLLRLARGSGVDGLAGMAGMRETADIRLLRPLLTFPKTRLEATCRAAGLDWVRDPSNASSRFARGRLRASAGVLAGEGLDTSALLLAARRQGQARAALERSAAELMATAARFHPEGAVEIDPAILRTAAEEPALRLLGRCLAAVGGAGHDPRHAEVERLLGRIVAGTEVGEGPDLTLAGCRVKARRGRVLLFREEGRLGPPILVEPGGTGLWDGRFLVRLDEAAPAPVTVAAAGKGGICGTTAPARGPASLPAAVLRTLPAARTGEEVVALPHLRYVRQGWPALAFEAVWRPPRPAAGPPFAV
ncbi:MAG TPA: tRNA lysidine(34) synthetase TilS [Azospirillaceae bacterium]|nr:tRNA lysidine(34) synthetase TilS [Azospirillaceae bacterium]